MTYLNWRPHFGITLISTRRLMEIESARTVIDQLSLPLIRQAELRERAHVRSTHYSTRIEGNRLTLAEAEQVLKRHSRSTGQGKANFKGRARDVREVQNYWDALVQIESWAAQRARLTEEIIQRTYAIVERSSRARPTAYRDGQNVIRDAATNAIVYLPPEAKMCLQ